MENFAPFAVAVLVAHAAGAAYDAGALRLAAAHIVLRAVYQACYLFNLASLRSLAFMTAAGCVVALMVLPAVQALPADLLPF